MPTRIVPLSPKDESALELESELVSLVVAVEGPQAVRKLMPPTLRTPRPEAFRKLRRVRFSLDISVNPLSLSKDALVPFCTRNRRGPIPLPLAT